MSRRRWLLLVLVLGLTGCALFARPLASRVVDALVWVSHRDVAQVSTAEFAAEPPAVLLDVRPLAEYAVSHLPGARQVDPGAPIATLADIPKDATIVTYCSVGWRSAELAERLTAAGYTQVKNLRGSLFRWAYQDRPLVNASGPTERVHPYDSTWGLLVEEDRRATEP